MAKLDHPNIVRLVGVVQSPSFMIAMELAPQGPLHKYLKKHKEMPLLNILILMLQVSSIFLLGTDFKPYRVFYALILLRPTQIGQNSYAKIGQIFTGNSTDLSPILAAHCILHRAAFKW